MGFKKQKPGSIICPQCEGEKTVLAIRASDKKRGESFTVVRCKVCKGKGRLN